MQQQQQQGLLKIYKYETNVDILLYDQCNQMLQWKVAQFLLKSDIFQNSTKNCPKFGQLLLENLLLRLNLVTLSTIFLSYTINSFYSTGFCWTTSIWNTGLAF